MDVVGEESSFEIDDCWNRVGIWSDDSPTCERLVKHIHCRNCEVYISSGRQLLDRVAPPGYLAEWQNFLARPKVADKAQLQGMVIFRIGTHWLSIPARIVSQIVDPGPYHRLPHCSNSAILGLMAVRNEMMLYVDLALIGKLDRTNDGDEKPTSRRSFVLAQSEYRWVVTADEVASIEKVDVEEIVPVCPTVPSLRSDLVKGFLKWKGYEAIVVDEKRLLELLRELRV